MSTLLVNRFSRDTGKAFGTLPAIVLAVVTCFSNNVCAKDPLYPSCLMNWMVEGSFHALIVDKTQQKLSVWRIRDGEPRMIESYRCATGENPGDKWVRGDMKTPEGVYFFCSLIDGGKLPDKYGLWAFTTDYPNFVDRRRGKSGDGIWLHGRDKPLTPKPDSNGCVALSNEDLVKVSRFIRLQGTPLIIRQRVRMLPRSRVIERERGIRDFVESWRQAWESRALKRYISHYNANFQCGWMDRMAWKEKKQRLLKRYSNISVKLGNIYLYGGKGLVTAIFTQSYRSDVFGSTGIKVLYLKTMGGEYTIFAEDYHQLVDDSFPVRPLLAKLGVEAASSSNHAAGDYRIRLVSTDESGRRPRAETETPRRIARSRGVVPDMLPDLDAAGAVDLPTIPNRRASAESRPARLLVACLSQSLPEVWSLDRVRRRPLEIAQNSQHGQTRPIGARNTASTPVRSDPLPVADTKMGPLHEISRSTVGVTKEVLKRFENADRGVRSSVSPKSRNREPGFRERVFKFLSHWKAAWEQKDLDRFLKMYDPSFQQGSMDYKNFCRSKRRFFKQYNTIRVELENVSTEKAKRGVRVRFLQTFRGDNYRDKGWKTMVLAEGKGRQFRIVGERWRAEPRDPSDSEAQEP